MRIKACRICKNKKLIKIGSLGNIAVSNFTVRPRTGTLSPLELVYCKNCTLLQLAHNPPRHMLYQEHYWYESHLNPTIIADLKSVVLDALKLTTPKKGDVFLDIGANDGTLLSFVPKPFFKIGIDPAANLIEQLKQHADIAIQDFFDRAEIQKKAKVITAIAVVYDLPNPNLFVRKLKQTLAVDGIGIIQLMTLTPMIENNDVGNICHEHIEYYSYESLVRLFEQNGLEIFKVKTNDMNGGSYRLFIRHVTQGSIPFQEKKYTILQLKAFFRKVEKNKRNFLDFVRNCKNKKHKIVAYGASTKGNTILQYYGLDKNSIAAAVDINPEKEGRFMISSNIPIVKTIPKCDYLWVLPYGFLKFFVKKEVEFRKKGGKFVVCTPKFKIL